MTDARPRGATAPVTPKAALGCWASRAVAGAGVVVALVADPGLAHHVHTHRGTVGRHRTDRGHPGTGCLPDCPERPGEPGGEPVCGLGVSRGLARGPAIARDLARGARSPRTVTGTAREQSRDSPVGGQRRPEGSPRSGPGVDEASSRNRAIGQKQATSRITHPTTAIPTSAAPPPELTCCEAAASRAPGTTPSVATVDWVSGNAAREICTPRPTTRASRGAVRQAAVNQRTDFHSHALVPSPKAPAAAIGIVAVKIRRADSRTKVINRYPNAAGTSRNSAHTPRTADCTVPVTWSGRPAEAENPAKPSTCSISCSTPRVSPAQPNTKTAHTLTHAVTTAPYCATPITSAPRERPSRRIAAAATCPSPSTVPSQARPTRSGCTGAPDRDPQGSGW